MPICRLLEGHAFEPDHYQAMSNVYEDLLQELGLKDRSDPLCEMLARKIIDLGLQGVRDPSSLHDLALKALGD